MMPPVREGLPTHGPLVLFSDSMHVVVVSPLDHFFSSLVWLEGDAVHCGLHGEIDEVPYGMRHRFLWVEGQGLRATLRRWGDVMLADRGRIRHDRYADVGLSYLGYWTDNGAYYYYKTEGDRNEQDTLLDVKADADARGIPYGYFQLDSWWYFKEPRPGHPGGLVEWAPQPEMFPDGLAAFQERLGLPLITHNRWFAKDNAYRDDHMFVEGEEMALPTTGDVFDTLMDDAVTWGVTTYEQDWLIPQYWGLPWLRERTGRTEAYMGWLDEAATEQSLTMQITMAGAAHLMDAIDRPSVTTVRTSIGYAPDVSKESFWPQFHIVNMLADALGVWPFKDNFRSSEEHAEQESLISATSAGMVGIGDAIGSSNVPFILRTCRQDGILLKPDTPATPLDSMFLPHRRPFTVSTTTDHPAGTWTYLAAYHIARDHEQRTAADELFATVAYDGRPLEDMFVFPPLVDEWRVDLAAELGLHSIVAYDWRRGTAAVVDRTLMMSPIVDLYDFAYYVLAPVFSNGLAFIGEPDKWITAADARFESIVEEGDGIEFRVSGAPGEQVNVVAYDARAAAMLAPVQVVVSKDGTATGAITR